MNERIRELMTKCNYVVDGTCDTSREEKLVQLIVRECAEVIFETPVKYTEIDIMHIIRDRVKEHFGVE